MVLGIWTDIPELSRREGRSSLEERGSRDRDGRVEGVGWSIAIGLEGRSARWPRSPTGEGHSRRRVRDKNQVDSGRKDDETLTTRSTGPRSREPRVSAKNLPSTTPFESLSLVRIPSNTSSLSPSTTSNISGLVRVNSAASGESSRRNNHRFWAADRQSR